MSKVEPITHEYETKSSAGTIAIGRKLADLLAPPRMLILRGDLGAGKTTLVKGIAAALGAADPDEVTSPTFTLVHEYAGTLDGKPVKLLHLDLYRLDAERQLDSLGIEEMRTKDAIVLVEWGEKFKSIRKHADGEIAVTSNGGDARKNCRHDELTPTAIFTAHSVWSEWPTHPSRKNNNPARVGHRAF